MTSNSTHKYSFVFVVFVTFVLMLAIAFSARSSAQGRISDSSTSVASEPLFLPPMVQQWGIQPMGGSPVSADVNQDGKPDLIMMVGGYPSTFEVLLGNGDGTIQPGELDPTGGQAASKPVIADVDKDGKPDVVVGQACAAVDCGGAALAGIVLGNGNGTFRSPFVYDLGVSSFSSSIAVADLNRDGKSDLVLTDWRCANTGFESCVSILIAEGNGRFRQAVVYDAGGSNAAEIIIADVNGDGKPDLLVSNQGGLESVGVLLGNGDGTFQPAVAYPVGGSYSSAPLVLDVNGDGKLDLVVYSQCATGPQGCVFESRIGVLLGNGDGTFQPVMVVSSGGGGIQSLHTADLNHDGIPDLVALHCLDARCQTDGIATLAVLLGNGDGTFTAGEMYTLSSVGWYYLMSLAVTDVNMDGIPDLITTKRSLDVWLGNGDGTFQPPVTYDTGGIYPASLVVSDMNGDGKPDLVVAGTWDPYHGGVAVLLNNSSTTQASTRTTLTASSSTSTFGQSVILTVQVASGTAAPSGNVILFDGTAAVANATLVNGKALIPVSYLPVGPNSITAVYQASPHFAASKSAALTHSVRIASSSVGLITSLRPAATNQAITYTATVNSQYGGLASGSVVFSSGSKTLGTAPLSRNQATLTTSFANPGTYSISARYAGDENNTGSASSALSQRIIASTTTILASSPIRSLSGQAVTLTATVFATTGFPPNGDLVTFTSGPVVLGTAPLIGAVASFTTSSLPVGISNITATFAGDANFAPSTSSALRQVVLATTKSVTSTTIASSLNPSIYGQSVTFVAKVTTSNGSVPTGKVAFRGSGFEIGRTTLNSS